MKFKILKGTHNEGGRTYGQGDVFESPYDLVAIFEPPKQEGKQQIYDRFQPMPPETAVTPLPKRDTERVPRMAADAEAVQQAAAERDQSDATEAQIKAMAAAAAPLAGDQVQAEDVSVNYPTAVANKLSVWQAADKKGFFITGVDNMALNEKPLAKNRVKTFITEYLEEQAAKAKEAAGTGASE